VGRGTGRGPGFGLSRMGLFSFFKRKHSRQPATDLSPETDNPLEALPLAGDAPFVIGIPVEKIRVLDFWGADPDNPFVLTLREYAAGRCRQYKNSPLEDFYRRWQPFAEKGCHAGEGHGPPWKIVGPKPQNTAAGRMQRREFREIARELGVSPEEVRGHIKGGPVTEAFGEITFRRLTRIYDSIARDGFRPESSAARYPSGFIFANDSDHRVSIGSGKHRVLVMIAMDWAKVPVELGPPKLPVITRREEVEQWPNVQAGRFTREQALALFDEIFREKHASGWQMRRN